MRSSRAASGSPRQSGRHRPRRRGGSWAAGGRRAYIGVAILCGGLIAEAAYRLIAVEAWDGFDLARTSVQVAIVDLGVNDDAVV